MAHLLLLGVVLLEGRDVVRRLLRLQRVLHRHRGRLVLRTRVLLLLRACKNASKKHVKQAQRRAFRDTRL